MGYRLHVAKKYEVEYSSSLGFNYEVVEFHKLLTSLGISYNGETWDDDIEVCKDDWKKGISKLKSYEQLEAEGAKGIEEALDELEEPVEEIINTMERILTESDHKNEYMLLSFF